MKEYIELCNSCNSEIHGVKLLEEKTEFKDIGFILCEKCFEEYMVFKSEHKIKEEWDV